MTGRIFLAFDTSAAHCAAALLWDTPLSARCETWSEAMAKGQAERLLTLIDDLMARHQVAMSDLSGICVGVGPGNFTGIRIAVSLARGLALGLGVPAIGVSGFEAASHAAQLSQPHWALIDAPRGQVYAQHFAPDPTPPQILLAEEAAALPPPLVRLSELSPDRIAAAVAAVGAAKSRSPQPRPAPFYLRGADAAPPSDPPPVILP